MLPVGTGRPVSASDSVLSDTLPSPADDGIAGTAVTKSRRRDAGRPASNLCSLQQGYRQRFWRQDNCSVPYLSVHKVPACRPIPEATNRLLGAAVSTIGAGTPAADGLS